MTGAASLSRTVFGRPFQNPLLLAAGTAGFGRELAGVLDLDRLGGLVTKAVSLAPRPGNAPPRVAEFRGGMLNSVGLANPGLTQVREELLPWLAGHLTRAQVLVNVVGFTVEEYGEVVAGLDGAPGVAGFELNLSCPNTSAGGIEFGADPACVQRIVGSVRRRTTLPISAKLSPVLPDLAGMAVVARDAGADAISVVNTLPGLLFAEDARTAATRLGHGQGGVSGPVLLPIGVLAVARVVERTGGMPVIGVGGVRSAADVRQYLRAGAALVGIGTAALADPRLPERIVRDLERGNG
ncbi:MAG TPA: dihydroorotate dehydrogenase [Gemmatimonadales bacterium]|nr:dihydroorotate dehydrogenase [Gemmatimonadales bacterium]